MKTFLKSSIQFSSGKKYTILLGITGGRRRGGGEGRRGGGKEGKRKGRGALELSVFLFVLTLSWIYFTFTYTYGNSPFTLYFFKKKKTCEVQSNDPKRVEIIS